MGRYRGHRGRRDPEHAHIRDGLRSVGALVIDVADLAKFVDLVVIWRGAVWFVEVKSARGELKPDQEVLRDQIVAAGGRWACWRCLDEALGEVMGCRDDEPKH